MPVPEPPWWYDAESQAMRALLSPAAALYGAISRRRLERGPTYPAQSTLPVICIGNFTAGGTGKTPFTAYVARCLLEHGARPAILARGYGGRIAGPHWVDPAADLAADVGDEPLQHASTAATLVSRDRPNGARAMERDPRGFTHILMDDGLQNTTLRKTLSFALVDGRRGLGNGCVMPAGPLRAPLAAQLRLADAIIINHGFAGAVDCIDRGRLAAFSTFPRPIYHATVAPIVDIAWLTNTPVVAFAGIGAPKHFFTMLRTLGAQVVAEVAFADHHAFSERDARDLLARATVASAILVTTEKDVARLSGLDGARAELRRAVHAIPIRMTFNAADAAEILSAIAHI